MDPETLRKYLDDCDAATPWLGGLGVSDLRGAHAKLLRMAAAGVTMDLLADLAEQLALHLPRSADPDMALANLERFVAAARNPLAVGTFFQRDRGALPVLLQIFATSQHLSDMLVVDPEGFDLLRMTEGRPVARRALVEEFITEVEALDHEQLVLRALRRFKRRETLRIAYGDIVGQQSLGTVTTQISYLADALLEAALRAAWRKTQSQRGTPLGPDGRPARLVILGMGKLGGLELNYSSDIDLILLYDADGQTDAQRRTTNAEFFEHLARELVRLITERTELGSVYRVDLRLRPDGSRGPMAMSTSRALEYYDLRGRTWERQAYIKARPVAGDLELGRQFLEQLAPWVYRRYLSRADIAGIKALKRRIEQQAHAAGADQRNVKTGHGGIRDVEFVIQFLQMLNGGDLPRVRTPNTIEALTRLEEAGCLTNQERTLLEENYAFLRKIEHRLQIMFDLQTHLLPADATEQRKLARRLGYAETPGRAALDGFLADYRNKTQVARWILDHLLHDAFSDEAQTEPEVDLVLDPDPGPQRIEAVLGRYPFRDVKQAYKHLMALAEENIRFLSARRCRHFLASIARRLLEAIAVAPDPDATLVNLAGVSDSLGGKGVLWELFSFNPPSLRLYVDLCAFSPYLCGILTSNPGMIDGLMDSLVLDKLPARQTLRRSLAELCRGAEDLDPILHSFKNDQQLRVGVRDLLGREDIEAVTGTLSDIAETCLAEVAAREHQRLAAKFGRPTVGDGPRRGQPCELVILGMGKFGGREMNYHSDLDVIFLYEAEGHTRPESRRAESTTNQHFFSELAQRIIKAVGRLSAYGRLYEIDARLRPTGRSGTLATSLPELARYFAEGGGQLWERQALCKARAVYGSDRARLATMAAVTECVYSRPWRREDAAEIRRMRGRLEETAAAGDLKRGSGGLVDVEFLAQMLQLRHGQRHPSIRVPGTLEAMRAAFKAGLLVADDYELLDFGYRFLRTIEGRLRLMNVTARDRLPQDPLELDKLARLLRSPASDVLLVDFEKYTRVIRARFQWLLDEAEREG